MKLVFLLGLLLIIAGAIGIDCFRPASYDLDSNGNRTTPKTLKEKLSSLCFWGGFIVAASTVA